MKKIILSIITLSLFIFVSCDRNKDDVNEQNKTKIIGKWRLDKTIDEEYKPVNTLISSDVYTGEPGDSIVFKTNGTVISYSDQYGPEEIEYLFSDNTTIVMDDEEYKIGKLTDTELYIYQEETDLSAGEKWMYKIYLVR